MEGNEAGVSDTKQEHHSLSHAYSTYLAHDVEEKTHWEDVCRTYRQYATFAMAQWANHQYRLHALPEEQRQFLPSGLRRETPEFQERARAYKEAAIRNQFCLDCILRHAGQPISQDVLRSQEAIKHSTDSQMSKVSSVLKSLARDWSAEGKEERDLSYIPILEKVQQYLPSRRPSNSNGSVTKTLGAPARLCVPGAGVGRLACELAALGYEVQGNEFSLYMLLASDFILNGGMTPDHPLKISPFLMESRNVHSPADPPRTVGIPDVDPYHMIMSPGSSETSDEMQETNQLDSSPNNNSDDGPAAFSMAAGEFVSIYGNAREKDRWDGFVACFFLDTSPSIVEYVTTMYHSLKPGGFVFHFGPLLWHWSGPAMRPDDKTWEDYESRYSFLDKKYLSSMDMSWEDVRAVFVNVGFEVVEERSSLPAKYTADQRSMMNMTYQCVQFVARKGIDPPTMEIDSSEGKTEAPKP